MNYNEIKRAMNYNEQLTEVLDLMPSTFSGKQFVSACVAHEYNIPQEIITAFLRINAELIKGTRSWNKLIQDEISNDNSTYEQECIQYLKEKGYKILKLNWEEQ
jgi:hypothetical protein